ncbi:hypothetical protein [Streptomyces sp. SID12501]|uniref:Uncharacterized protein n=1 Tax=Streptomyces sp. SID12501 TaxID=2706042 RepID=A0A6B3C6C7_9ACTN|nr:hypothetical protein [Streptomyces sp. SID12501]NEC92199.1 hypothetical protein [Streptomyces sp. SID12501]
MADLFGVAALRLERDVELAELPERVAEVMAGLLRGVLGDLELSVEQRRTADVVVPRRLREMRGALEAGPGPAAASDGGERST